ncbi:hypothetical protein [Oceanobacillus locisalsi]|uniref:Uncharacterized protein n=1 Tax=Oceanobacillus locisalsi TaxID=546107 RepID=A0ABW3NEU6_9BACI
MKNIVTARIITTTTIITNAANQIIMVTNSVIKIKGDSATVVTTSIN